MRLLLDWLLAALIVVAVAWLLPGVRLAGFGTALLVSVLLAIFSVFLGPLFRFIGAVLTLPAILLTFGLFYLVVRFLVNVLLLHLTDALVDGFSIRNTSNLMLASLLISFLHHLVFRDRRADP